MKFLLILFCIFGIINQTQAATPREIEASVEKIKVTAAQTVEDILAVPFDEQTFENSLGLWSQLSSQLQKQSNLLHKASKSTLPKEREMAIWALEELQIIGLELSQNDELTHALINASQRVIENKSDNLLEQGIAESYMRDKAAKSMHFQVTRNSNEKVTKNNKLSLLSLPNIDLTKDTLPTNVDVLCIQEIFFDDAYQVYNLLFGHSYDHIVYFKPCNARLDTSSNQYTGGTLILSKYPMEEFHTNEDYCDVLVKDENHVLGHIYVIQSLDNTDSSSKLLHVITDMQTEALPATLCANFDSSSNSHEVEALMDTYFTRDEGYAQFLCASTHTLAKASPAPTKASKALFSMVGMAREDRDRYGSSNDDDRGSRNDSRDSRSESRDSGNDRSEYHGRADVAVKQDTDGRGKAEINVSLSKPTDSGGSCSASISGSIRRDSDGKVYGEIETKASISF